MKKLTRTKYDRIFGGVCGGLAEYFDFDVTIIRLIFVLLALSAYPIILIYLIMWIVIPESKIL